jgi:hypothetical protein
MSGPSVNGLGAASSSSRAIPKEYINASLVKRGASGVEVNKEAYNAIRGEGISHEQILQALRETNSSEDFQALIPKLENLESVHIESQARNVLLNIIGAIEISADANSISRASRIVREESASSSQSRPTLEIASQEVYSLLSHKGLIGSITNPSIIDPHDRATHDFKPWTEGDEALTRDFSSRFTDELKRIDPTGQSIKFVLDHIQGNFQDLDDTGRLAEASDPVIREIHTRIKNGIGDLVEDIGLQKLKEKYPEPDFRVLSSVATTVGNHELDYVILKKLPNETYEFADIIGSAKTQFTEPSFRTDLDRLTAIIDSDNPIKFRDPDGEKTISASAFRQIFHQSDSKVISRAKKNTIIDIGVTPGSDDPIPRDSVKTRVIFGETTNRLKGKFLSYIMKNITR